MNILIRNYTKSKNSTQLAVIIDLMVEQFKEELQQKKRIRFDDEKLSDKFEMELQPNGNYLIEYDEEVER